MANDFPSSVQAQIVKWATQKAFADLVEDEIRFLERQQMINDETPPEIRDEKIRTEERLATMRVLENDIRSAFLATSRARDVLEGLVRTLNGDNIKRALDIAYQAGVAAQDALVEIASLEQESRTASIVKTAMANMVLEIDYKDGETPPYKATNIKWCAIRDDHIYGYTADDRLVLYLALEEIDVEVKAV